LSPPPPTCSPLFPYTTLFRSLRGRFPPATPCAPLPREFRPIRCGRRVVRASSCPPPDEIGVPTKVSLDHSRQQRRLHRNLESHRDRMSTRLNSSHVSISYAVF